jgi:hypothetical protein
MDYIFWLYLATRLDAIHGMFHGMMPLAGGALVIICFAGALFSDFDITRKDNLWYYLRWWRRGLIAMFCIGAIGTALVPTKKDAMIIAGGVGVIEASKAVAGSEIAKKSVAIIEKWLQEQLDAIPAKKGDASKKADAKTETNIVSDAVKGAVQGAVEGAAKAAKQ